jgi:hypothetical protein
MQKIQVGTKVKFTHPRTADEEVGTIAHWDRASDSYQLLEWRENGQRTRWEPANSFQAIQTPNKKETP